MSRLAQRRPDITLEWFEQNGKPSFLAYCGATRPKKFTVLLNAHVDVVPGKPAQFQAKKRGERLYGRGTLDMKTAAVVLADAFCELAGKLDYPLGLQIVSDEEVGGHDGTAHQIAKGVAADFVICGEFSAPHTICSQSRGICQARLQFTGRTAHSAYLWNGDNAILQAHQTIGKLLKQYPIPKEFDWVTTANVAALRTTHLTINQVPDTASLELDIRYVPTDPNFATLQNAQAFLRRIAPRTQIEVLAFEPAHYADPHHRLSKKLADAVAATTNRPTKFVQKPGAADARFYSATGTPAVIFGLQGEGLHGDEEYVLLSSIPTYRDALVRFLCSVPN